eukprot:CAMPEP_0194686492 /NCGR_PEP_ID=MMETSP0295-20121207/15541_1 /TAXON_ID=39354 /ORGANISM="Heterosigma akashiwo, Strain CCMP2393" /LENGTH=85 /DNA_ID=CAMNT_0039574339 /DNA_START=291 /DNA_END=548 /DNA_ORIENTATION=+
MSTLGHGEGGPRGGGLRAGHPGAAPGVQEAVAEEEAGRGAQPVPAVLRGCVQQRAASASGQKGEGQNMSSTPSVDSGMNISVQYW